MQYIGESDHMAWVVRDVMKEKIESRKKKYLYVQGVLFPTQLANCFCFALF